MENTDKLKNYEKFGRSIVWEFPEKLDFADGSFCNTVFESMNFDGTRIMVFNFDKTEYIHTSVIGAMIIMKKKLIAAGIEPIYIFSEYMCKITKTVGSYEYFNRRCKK